MVEKLFVLIFIDLEDIGILQTYSVLKTLINRLHTTIYNVKIWLLVVILHSLTSLHYIVYWPDSNESGFRNFHPLQAFLRLFLQCASVAWTFQSRLDECDLFFYYTQNHLFIPIMIIYFVTLQLVVGYFLRVMVTLPPSQTNVSLLKILCSSHVLTKYH